MLNTSSLDRMLSLNRAFDEAFAASDRNRVWVPDMDVAERNDAYVVLAELPGVDPNEVEVSFQQNMLTVRGTKPASFDLSREGELRVFAAERVHGSFERSVRLPEFVDADRIAAAFEHGVLTVTIPKAEAAKARKIPINAGGTGNRIRDVER